MDDLIPYITKLTHCHNFEDFNVLNAGPAMGPILCKERLLVNFWVTKC